MSFGGVPLGGTPFADAGGAAGTTTTLTCAVGTFTLTGEPAGLTASLTMVAGTGLFVLSGQDATFAPTKVLTAEPGIFTLTGEPVTFRATLSIALDAGTFTLTGEAITMTLTKIPHHYRVRDDAQPQYLADLAVEPLYLITDGFAAKYRVDDIAEESD